MYKRTCFLLLLILCGCSLLRSYNDQTFNFNYAGDDYEIVSRVQGNEVLENHLMMYDDEGTLVLEALDENSDGELDKLILGEITLSEANHIYYVGIEQALESGNLDSKNVLRKFEITKPPYNYTIQTFGYDDYTSPRRMVYGYVKQVEVFNELTITHIEEGIEKVLRDLSADGKLDTAVNQENITISEYQEVYQQLLDEALEQGRMRKTGDIFIVLPSE